MAPCLGAMFGSNFQMMFHVSHFYREGNQATNGLASRAPSIESSTWWHSAPSFVSHLVNNNTVGKSNFKLYVTTY